MVALFDGRWKDVLGMNARALQYISKSNKPDAVKRVNNKLVTKRILQKAGLATPLLYKAIHSRQELKQFRWSKLPPSFVLKPTTSSGGAGIIVIFGRNKKGNWVTADKSEILIPALRNHVLDILDGNFSNGNVPDSAFFEQRVKVHSSLKLYSIKGVPDIRMLVYNQVPVMSMLRLPTAESVGRANLHAGGVGVGIDLSLGVTTAAIHHGHLIEFLPKTRLSLSGIEIPYWDDILLLSTRACQALDVNFAGVDIAVDREDGPLILEVNARPGLDIQFANLSPLRSRLRRVEGLKMKSLEKKIRISKSLFGAEIEHEIEDFSGRGILGLEEEVEIVDEQGNRNIILAKVDTGAYRTTIDHQLARKLNLHEPIVRRKGVRSVLGNEQRPVVSVMFHLRGRPIKTEAFLADRSNMNYDIIIGRRDLRGFLINPVKKKKIHRTS